MEFPHTIHPSSHRQCGHPSEAPVGLHLLLPTVLVIVLRLLQGSTLATQAASELLALRLLLDLPQATEADSELDLQRLLLGSPLATQAVSNRTLLLGDRLAPVRRLTITIGPGTTADHRTKNTMLIMNFFSNHFGDN